MAENQEKPIAREPWQRLLQAGADQPAETTDARIRAAARRPPVRRPARWWLPASLAASFVLAFMLVQSQFGEKPAPAFVTESDLAEPEPVAVPEVPAMEAATDAYTPPETRDQQAPTEETPERASPPPTTQLPAAPRAEPPSAALWSGSRTQSAAVPESGSSAERESRVTGADGDSDAAPGEDLQDVVVTGSRKRESDLKTRTTTVQATAATVARYRSPEAWYAAIEALRADGRTEEADRELAQLEEAHPGWVQRHLAEQERIRDLQ